MYEINGYEKQETLEKIGFSNLLDILFDCSDYFSLKDIFVNMFSDIFLRVCQNNDYQDTFQSLEDLCFFKDKKLFMGTVSHALLLGIIPINDVIRDFIIESEGWTSVEDSIVCLPDCSTNNI